jgi:hypothetical protein
VSVGEVREVRGQATSCAVLLDDVHRTEQEMTLARGQPGEASARSGSLHLCAGPRLGKER